MRTPASASSERPRNWPFMARLGGICAGVLLAAVLGTWAGTATVGLGRQESAPIKRLHWWRSRLAHDGRLVRLAVITRSGERVLRRAYVRRTPHQIRIGLFKRQPAGYSEAIGYAFCVEITLRFEAEGLTRIDAARRLPIDRPAVVTRGRNAETQARSTSNAVRANVYGSRTPRIFPVTSEGDRGLHPILTGIMARWGQFEAAAQWGVARFKAVH